MNETLLNDIETASEEVVNQAARHFAQTLAETPKFQEFEEAFQSFRQDTEAQTAYQALQKKQESLRTMIMLNKVDEEDRIELIKLQNDFYSKESVLRYLNAQENLISICQGIGDLLSEAIGLDFGSSCRVGGCCG